MCSTLPCSLHFGCLSSGSLFSDLSTAQIILLQCCAQIFHGCVRGLPSLPSHVPGTPFPWLEPHPGKLLCCRTPAPLFCSWISSSRHNVVLSATLPCPSPDMSRQTAHLLQAPGDLKAVQGFCMSCPCISVPGICSKIQKRYFLLSICGHDDPATVPQRQWKSMLCSCRSLSST